MRSPRVFSVYSVFKRDRISLLLSLSWFDADPPDAELRVPIGAVPAHDVPDAPHQAGPDQIFLPDQLDGAEAARIRAHGQQRREALHSATLLIPADTTVTHSALPDSPVIVTLPDKPERLEPDRDSPR